MKKNLLLLLIMTMVLTCPLAMSQTKRPVIGISCSWSETEASVLNTYLNSVMMAGGLPVIIPLTADSEILAAQLENVDALVMTGGEDFDPLTFGQEPAQGLAGVVPQRDQYDLTLIKAAAQGLPILAVCRGLQGVNIAFGGTLYQDIPSTYPAKYIKHRQTSPGKFGSHTITIEPDSELSKILGTQKTVVNSLHHQAIDKLAPGFKVTARATDGIIEAIEKMDGAAPILCVQFHPEGMTNGGDKEMLKIFQYIVNQANKTKK